MTDELFTGFLDDYYAECDEHLTGARAALLALESAPDEPARQRPVIDELFRFYHSLKGISAMVELRPAEQLAHRLEDYLRAVRAGELPVTADGISLLIAGTELLERIVNAHRTKQDMPATDDVMRRIGDALPRADKGTGGAARAVAGQRQAAERTRPRPPALEVLFRSDARAPRPGHRRRCRAAAVVGHRKDRGSVAIRSR